MITTTINVHRDILPHWTNNIYRKKRVGLEGRLLDIGFVPKFFLQYNIQESNITFVYFKAIVHFSMYGVKVNY